MKVQDVEGKYIRFTKEIEQQLSVFDAGMMARVIGVKHFNSEVFELICDFSMFEQYNRQFAHPNYFDTGGKATLFVWETNWYPKNLRDSVLAEETNPIQFEVVPDEEAMKITDTKMLVFTKFDVEGLLDHFQRSPSSVWVEHIKDVLKGAM